MEISSFSIFYFVKEYEKFAEGIRKVLSQRLEEKEDGDLIVVIGGDGTFLYAQNKFRDKFFVGVNPTPNERVGFYMIIDKFNLDALLDISEGKFTVINLPRLVFNNIYALNEVQIFPIPSDKLLRITIRIKLKNGSIYELEEKNSGLLIYTPTGHFGFARNLESGFDPSSIGLVSIAPFSGFLKQTKSLLIPINALKYIEVGSDQTFFVSLDSRDRYKLKKIKIRLGKPLKYVIPQSIISNKYKIGEKVNIKNFIAFFFP